MSVLLIRVVRSTAAQLSHEGRDPHPTDRAAPLPFRYMEPGSGFAIVRELVDDQCGQLQPQPVHQSIT
jgi:hypothetical protein